MSISTIGGPVAALPATPVAAVRQEPSPQESVPAVKPAPSTHPVPVTRTPASPDHPAPQAHDVPAVGSPKGTDQPPPLPPLPPLKGLTVEDMRMMMGIGVPTTPQEGATHARHAAGTAGQHLPPIAGTRVEPASPSGHAEPGGPTGHRADAFDAYA